MEEFMYILMNKWPVGVKLYPHRPFIADHYIDFNKEMEKYGESLDDAVHIHCSFSKYDSDGMMIYPEVKSIWTKTRVYFPAGECCYFVESVPIPFQVPEEVCSLR